VGQGNGYGHPHSQTLALLDQLRIPLLRTDVNGTITVMSDGKLWEVVSTGHAPRGPPGEIVKAGEGTKQSEDAEGRSRLVNVNSATYEVLVSLPGVGPTISQRIIDSRPYRDVEDLLRVKGIGEKTLAQLRARVTVK
jgi:competence ComEA-like helix-hairpin-helix protein